jgi:hypothetical protein
MKSVKLYLIAVCSLLGLAIAAGVVVWYLYQNLDGAQPQVIPPSPTESTSIPETETPVMEVKEKGNEGAEPVTLTADSLGEEQREILASFGLEDTHVTLTPERIACAENTLGEKRFEEVVNGSAPTPFEALGLLACLKE